LNGYLGLYVDEPDIVHFEPGKSVTIDGRNHIVSAVRRTDRGHQVVFEGVESRELAEDIRGHDVWVEQRRALGENEFWPEQLSGLIAKDESGRQIGVVRRWVPGAAQDRLVVGVDDDEFEIPFISEFIPVVDVEQGFVEIRPIPGLIEPLS
jgi:16S rRNA processing protein RimM